MFQRLKGNLDSFLDSKIAEEQAKQRQTTQSPSRKPPGSTRGSGTRRPASRVRNTDDEKGIPQKGPDPSEFVIDDEDGPSRTATPKPPPKEEGAPNVPSKDDNVVAEDDAPSPSKPREEKASTEELPIDVRQKLRKLEKLESRYHDLLRSYRIAHSRVTAIEPFEAALRENTPLTSVSDPTALIEYLSQLNLRSDMVMEELKRVTGDRDSIKAKLEDAERKTKEAYDEAAGLRQERDALLLKKPSSEPKDQDPDLGSDQDPLGVAVANGEATASKKELKDDTVASDHGDDFFSYESELPRLQSELEEKTRLIGDLNSENNSLKSDLDEARQSDLKSRQELDQASKVHHSAKQNFEREKAELEQKSKDSETAVQHITAQLDKIAAMSGSENESLPARIQTLDELLTQAKIDLDAAKQQVAELNERATSAEDARQRLEKDSKDAAGQDAETKEARDADKKRIDTLDNLVKTLRSQLDGAASTRKSLHTDLDTLRTELQESMRECEATKKASLSEKDRGIGLADIKNQLQKTERERDDAYQMIVSCGSCKLPEQKPDEPSENATKDKASAPEEEASATSPQVGESGSAAAKKKKSKGRKKKKAGGAAVSTGEVQPAEAPEIASPAPETNALLSEEPDSVLTTEQKLAIKAHVLNSIKELNPNHGSEGEASAEKTRQLEHAIAQNESEISDLKTSIEKKEERIIQLADKLKGEEELREEIEELKDSLLEFGNEHVSVKDQLRAMRVRNESRESEHAEDMKQVEGKCKTLQKRCEELESQIKDKTEEHEKIQVELEELKTSGSATKEIEEKLATVETEKKALDVVNAALKTQLEALKSSHSETIADSDKKQKALAADFDELKSNASSLQTDLAAANELAQTRYKDLTSLREHLNKIQPELNSLRQEAAELKKTKEELNSTAANVRKLETKEKDLRSEISVHKSHTQERDAEIKSLNDKLKQSNERKATLEESNNKAQKDLQRAENSRKDTEEAKEKLSKELSKAQDELRKSRDKLQDLEKQVAQFTRDIRSLKDELELKSAQSASSQSLMDSMQDQTRELSTQMKEVNARCESLEEELADAQRLLSERSREGETMRRLLNDVESRAEGRVKEMRERLDLATEERDRAEEEASNAGRRRARELEDAKNKLREAERNLTRALEEKDDFERKEKKFRSQQETLERRAAQQQEEVTEVRSAMAQLRDAMDEGEKQNRDSEKEKVDLRKALEDKEQRLEKLQKSSKGMTEELSQLRSRQNAAQTRQPSLTSARSSLDSSRMSSPTPKMRNGTPIATTGGPDGQPSIDYVYLKNVLLQFLEQKDKKHQMQLVPVLGMLLHFDKKDQDKWASVIASL